MTTELEIRARNIRAKRLAEERKQSKASTGPGTRASSNGRPTSALNRGDGIDRAALWRKAMAAENTAAAGKPAEPTHQVNPAKGGSTKGLSRDAMWRRAHEQARLLPPVRGGE